MRVWAYIDGFNLYHRALRKTSFKWLDLHALLTQLLPEDAQIEKIKYFTAMVLPLADPGQPIRQQVYIDALKVTSPCLEVIFGQFKDRKSRLPLVEPEPGRPRFVQVHKAEEKGSDVNLAVHLLRDAYREDFDCALVISNDGDISAAMQFVRSDTAKEIWLVPPSPDKKQRPVKMLKDHCHKIRRIPKTALEQCQLPDSIEAGDRTITKPDRW